MLMTRCLAFPNLCHLDHLLGDVQISLVVLSDLRYDEARMVPTDHPTGT